MKNKKDIYSSKDTKPSQTNEPAVAYNNHVLQVLNGLSYADINNIHLSGEALTDIQEQTLLNAQALASVVGVGKSKFYDLVKTDDLGAKNIDALADFAALWQKGLDAFDGNTELLNEWLETRNLNLGGTKPIELLSSRMGRRELEKAFLRIEYSTYG